MFRKTCVCLFSFWIYEYSNTISKYYLFSYAKCAKGKRGLRKWYSENSPTFVSEDTFDLPHLPSNILPLSVYVHSKKHNQWVPWRIDQIFFMTLCVDNYKKHIHQNLTTQSIPFTIPFIIDLYSILVICWYIISHYTKQLQLVISSVSLQLTV